MRRSFRPVAVACATAAVLAAPALAQQPPRSFEASPEVYKVLAQGPTMRVVEVTWKPGQRDAPHGHPASAVYYLSDCELRLTAADGSVRDVKPRAGQAVVQPAIVSHTVQNIGGADCRLVMVE